MENCITKVNVKVDAGNTVGELKHTWRYIGYDECNYTTTPEGANLISKFGKLPDAPYFIRTHHLLCTGNCHGTYKWGSTNVYVENEQGTPIYNWDVLDEILDVYLKNNCKPFFEIGFMPMDLVDPRFLENENEWHVYRNYQNRGWASPPKDYSKWQELIYNIVRHCVERYGQDEVVTWYWEFWNEPDIDYYWRGTVEEFCKLYDYTEAAVHAALENARLGGPATTGPRKGTNSLFFLEKFLEHCANWTNYVTGKKGTRLDYVTFHVKGGGFPFRINAPKSTPSVKSMVEQVKTGLEAIKKYGFADKEVVLSEADPDGWAAGGIYDNRNLNFRNTEYFSSFVASSYHNIEKLAKSMNMDVRVLAWTFMFIGERCFEGTRAFTTQGIDKAVFNLFKLYAKLGSRSLYFDCSQEKAEPLCKDNPGTTDEPEVSGMASITEQGTVQIMLYCHHNDWDVEGEFAVNVEVINCSLGDKALLKHYRIDKDHSNAYSEWVRQGKPKYPSKEQYEAIKAKDGLELFEPEKTINIIDGKLNINFALPVHAISFIEISAIH